MALNHEPAAVSLPKLARRALGRNCAPRAALLLRVSQLDAFVLVLSEAVLVLDRQWR